MSEERARDLAAIEPPNSILRIVKFLESILRTSGPQMAVKQPQIAASAVSASQFAQGLTARFSGMLVTSNRSAFLELAEHYQVTAVELLEFTRWLIRWNSKRMEMEVIRDPAYLKEVLAQRPEWQTDGEGEVDQEEPETQLLAQTDSERQLAEGQLRAPDSPDQIRLRYRQQQRIEAFRAANAATEDMPPAVQPGMLAPSMQRLAWTATLSTASLLGGMELGQGQAQSGPSMLPVSSLATPIYGGTSSELPFTHHAAPLVEGYATPVPAPGMPQTSPSDIVRQPGPTRIPDIGPEPQMSQVAGPQDISPQLQPILAQQPAPTPPLQPATPTLQPVQWQPASPYEGQPSEQGVTSQSLYAGQPGAATSPQPIGQMIYPTIGVFVGAAIIDGEIVHQQQGYEAGGTVGTHGQVQMGQGNVPYPGGPFNAVGQWSSGGAPFLYPNRQARTGAAGPLYDDRQSFIFPHTLGSGPPLDSAGGTGEAGPYSQAIDSPPGTLGGAPLPFGYPLYPGASAAWFFARSSEVTSRWDGTNSFVGPRMDGYGILRPTPQYEQGVWSGSPTVVASSPPVAGGLSWARQEQAEGLSAEGEEIPAEPEAISDQPKLSPEAGQMTLLLPTIHVASEESEASGAAATFDWKQIAGGAGELDSSGLASMLALAPGAQAIYPALPEGSLGPNAVSFALAPSLLSEVLNRGYGALAAENASALSSLSSGQMSRASGSGPIKAKIVPTQRVPIKSSAALLSGRDESTGALGHAGEGQASRGGAMDFFGMPVRLAPSLSGNADLKQELAARTADSPIASARPSLLSSLQSRLFPSFGTVDAEPDKAAWTKSAPAFGLRDANPTTLLSPDARIKPLTASSPIPQMESVDGPRNVLGPSATGLGGASPLSVPSINPLRARMGIGPQAGTLRSASGNEPAPSSSTLETPGAHRLPPMPLGEGRYTPGSSERFRPMFSSANEPASAPTSFLGPRFNEPRPETRRGFGDEPSRSIFQPTSKPAPVLPKARMVSAPSWRSSGSSGTSGKAGAVAEPKVVLQKSQGSPSHSSSKGPVNPEAKTSTQTEHGMEPHEVNILANEVYALLKRRLASDSERNGKW